MKENKLAELSLEFSVDIINLVKQLKENREAIISNQIPLERAACFTQAVNFPTILKGGRPLSALEPSGKNKL